MLTLTIPVCYMAETNEKYSSYHVESLPVLSNKKPAMIYVPNNSMHFKFGENEMTFSHCETNGWDFAVCHVNNRDLSFTDCIHQLIYLKSEYEARKVIRNIYNWKYWRDQSLKFLFQHCRVIFTQFPSCVAKTFEDGVYVTSSESIHLSIEKPNDKPVPHWLSRMNTEPDEILKPGLLSTWLNLFHSSGIFKLNLRCSFHQKFEN